MDAQGVDAQVIYPTAGGQLLGKPFRDHPRVDRLVRQIKSQSAPPTHDTKPAVANTAADQLRNVGIEAAVLGLDPVALYTDAVTQNRVDAIVGWHQAGGDLATALASRYGCRALEATPVSTTTAGATRTSTPSPTPTPSGPAAPDAHHDGDTDDEKPGAGIGSACPGA
jgi:ABC-type transport system substrate-binding protein